MTKKDYQYEQARNLWLYSGIVADGYIIINGVVYEEGAL